MKKTLTADQTVKRDERRAQFRALIKRVADMSAVQKAELGKYGARKLDGGSFSVCNTMLLAIQLPHGSVVAGFRQWLKAGRCVIKGQHGASIWVPIGGKKTTDAVTGATETDSSGDKPGFVCGCVFDISQTAPLEAEHPVATVSPEIAAAFGMTNLPNVRVDVAGEFSLESEAV